MIHQIRKMVSMVTFVVRCATPIARMNEAMTQSLFDIPKAPSLGLLLERPVFEAYNDKAKTYDRDPIDFNKYDEEILEFKQRNIYNQIFKVEEEEHV
jgi:tRNA pseudouridine38-40 synthase